MGVAAEVAKDLFGTAEGSLGVDNPTRPVQALSAAARRAVRGIVASRLAFWTT